MLAGVAVGAHSPIARARADPGGWPSHQCDAQNTGYHPDAVGPVERFGSAWQVSLANRPGRSAPVISDGVLYVGSHDRTLYAFDVTDGSKRWSIDTGAAIRSPPGVADGIVTVANSDGVAFGIDTESGDEEWRHAKEIVLGTRP